MKEVWTKEKYKQFLFDLKKQGDDAYISFSQKLITSKYPMIGIRTPLLANISKQVLKTDVASFFEVVGTTYYEEVLLTGFLIAVTFDITRLKAFLPLIDNWAICDMTAGRLKGIKKEKETMLSFIEECLTSSHTYTVRFGFVLLLSYYMEEEYLSKVFALITKYQQDSYYIQMAVAWLLSYCYFVDRQKTLAFLDSNIKDTFTYNKALSKIRESLKVTKEEKARLKELYR